MKASPFIYSDDNKRYHTLNYYLKHLYGQKVFRLPLDAHFTCPNRDGTAGYGGCSFCSDAGSGDTILGQNLDQQITEGFLRYQKKWPNALAIAYFQAFTNTYAPLDQLKDLYTPFFYDDRFIEVAIATRSDCLDEDKIAYFSKMNEIKPCWLEIGLQSIHPTTSHYINRGHNLNNFQKAIDLCHKYGLKVCVHIINGLPHETANMMLETAQYCGSLPISGIKIHMFHLLQNTLEAYRYHYQPYPILDRDSYVDIVINQLGYLDPKTVIFRLTGDGLVDDLIGPEWTIKKGIVLNEIDKKMRRDNRVQGDLR